MPFVIALASKVWFSAVLIAGRPKRSSCAPSAGGAGVIEPLLLLICELEDCMVVELEAPPPAPPELLPLLLQPVRALAARSADEARPARRRCVVFMVTLPCWCCPRHRGSGRRR